MTSVNYKASRTGSEFHKSDAFVRGIMGPYGSGKSVSCVIEIYLRAVAQVANSSGVRKSRWVVVRNTLPELETTAMKTWKDWFPPGDPAQGFFGKMTGKPPYTHYVKHGLPDGTKLDLEVQFIALDRPEDQKKLLGIEVSGIWFNEAREIDKAHIDAGTGRVGRYPSVKDGGCTHPCIIMDTNPPDDSHWWYKFAEEDTPEGWRFFQQPSGLDPDADNLENLNQPENWKELSTAERRAHGRKYYEKQLGGKTEEWVNVYVHGRYGQIKQGKPVYGDSYNSDLHLSKTPILLQPSGRLYVGVDCSGRHPSAVMAQKSGRGQIQVVRELCVTDDEGMGAVQYSRLLKNFIDTEFPDHDIYIWGDPAGGFRSQNDERTYFDILRAEGLHIRPSSALRIPERVQTVFSVLGRMIDGQPAIIFDQECKQLVRGFNGGYRYRKINTSGDARYDPKPEKNRFADVHDALQYLLTGMGENKRMLGINREHNKTYFQKSWSVF